MVLNDLNEEQLYQIESKFDYLITHKLKPDNNGASGEASSTYVQDCRATYALRFVLYLPNFVEPKISRNDYETREEYFQASLEERRVFDAMNEAEQFKRLTSLIPGLTPEAVTTNFKAELTEEQIVSLLLEPNLVSRMTLAANNGILKCDTCGRHICYDHN